MRITAASTLRDVAFRVCTALHRAGTTAVLSGGGAATIHAPDAIQSHDLDFILTVHVEGQAPSRALEELGFTPRGQHYEHALSSFFLEFPPGPLAIGGELVETWDTLEEEELLLHLLTPTDSCRDRLAAYYHFGDRTSLEQARQVYLATRPRVNLRRVRAWSQREGHLERFQDFQSAIRA